MAAEPPNAEFSTAEIPKCRGCFWFFTECPHRADFHYFKCGDNCKCISYLNIAQYCISGKCPDCGGPPKEHYRVLKAYKWGGFLRQNRFRLTISPKTGLVPDMEWIEDAIHSRRANEEVETELEGYHYHAVDRHDNNLGRHIDRLMEAGGSWNPSWRPRPVFEGNSTSVVSHMSIILDWSSAKI